MPIRNWRTVDELLAHNTVPDAHGCWIWQRAITHRHTSQYAYGTVWIDGKSQQAHRVVYAHLHGPIPEGRHIHHTCNNTRCVNPAHLQMVTPKQHVYVNRTSCATRTHCPHGHAYTPENTTRRVGLGKNGKPYLKRFCRECHRADGRRRQRTLVA